MYNTLGSFDLMSQEFSEGSIIYYEFGLQALNIYDEALGLFVWKSMMSTNDDRLSYSIGSIIWFIVA